MGKVKFSIAMSLDGFLAGPDPRFEEPLGDGGERLHEWMLQTTSFQEAHGGGEAGTTGRDDEIVRESSENTGAYLMGRQMFGGGDREWDGRGRAGGATTRRFACPCSF